MDEMEYREVPSGLKVVLLLTLLGVFGAVCYFIYIVGEVLNGIL